MFETFTSDGSKQMPNVDVFGFQSHHSPEMQNISIETPAVTDEKMFRKLPVGDTGMTMEHGAEGSYSNIHAGQQWHWQPQRMMGNFAALNRLPNYEAVCVGVYVCVCVGVYVCVCGDENGLVSVYIAQDVSALACRLHFIYGTLL